MIAYKLMKLRKNGTLGPLFINRRKVVRIGETHTAEDHPTNGFAHRPGWHCTRKPDAPHLKQKEDRVWIKVLISDFTEHVRPENQGGLWYLANKITFLEYV